ncbi:hypothetical protein [Parabacteroides sp. PF5-6]|uniref:hypothetical protein n=1 Tax=Parabacteroides sp. PF5-6 TaxID=1742403 RepID=UPI0024070E4D|nr:hypothetical protein [Parabacteroides sp. PF5-6]MDF9831148.1 hypothetical protein [Parabacteroides sp. PF5-6]
MLHFRFYVLLYCLFCLTGATKAFASPNDSIPLLFHQQQQLYPQEKLYLHTDRAQYLPGENVWFRAYLVDAATHEPVPYSRYVYAELLDQTDTPISRVMLEADRECYQGYLPIPGALSAGEYSLRAYTRYMENTGPDYFFRKSLRIGTGAAGESTVANDEFQVSFFPEGGNLPVGAATTIAFRAEQAEPIRGRVVDEAGQEVTVFNSVHAGMGTFQLHAEAGKTYYAECTGSQGQTRRFALPEAKADAVALQLRSVRNNYVVSLLTGKGAAPAADYTLLIHCRGTVYYADRWGPAKPYLSFDKTFFPSGVVQVLLLNAEGQSVSERLVYNMAGNDRTQSSIVTDKIVYDKGEKVGLSIYVSDLEGNPLRGTFSLSVTDRADAPPEPAVTILSSLLLTSELKDPVEGAAWYFDQPTADKLHILDCLMLTQGWQRYAVDRVLAQDFEIPEIAYEQEMPSPEEEAFHILLDDVTVEEKAKPRNIRSPFVVGRPDARLTLEDIEKRNPHSIKDLLRGIPGFRITRGVPYHRGTMVKILVDGMDILSGAGADSDLEDFLFVEDVLQVDLVVRLSAVMDTEKLLVITTKSAMNYLEKMPAPGMEETEEVQTVALPERRATLLWLPVVSLSLDGEAEISFNTPDTTTSYDVVIEGITDEGEIIRGQAVITVQ